MLKGYTVVKKSVKLKHVQTKSINSVQIKVYKKMSCFSILQNNIKTTFEYTVVPRFSALFGNP